MAATVGMGAARKLANRSCTWSTNSCTRSWFWPSQSRSRPFDQILPPACVTSARGSGFPAASSSASTMARIESGLKRFSSSPRWRIQTSPSLSRLDMLRSLLDGLQFELELVPPAMERTLVDVFEELRWDAIVIRGQAAKRTARHYGLDYDYEARAPMPGEPVPDWLEPARALAADFAGFAPEDLAEILVQRYPPGSAIGWHRDAPAFDTVIGLSLGGFSRLRFQRGKGDARELFEVGLEPRSGYVLADEARRSWEHSIPPTKELRYSITFRTLR